MVNRYTVWVGGTEVCDTLLPKEEADKLANLYKKHGYEDVCVEKYHNVPQQVESYLWQEFAKNNIPKYYRYFEQWISNLTNEQIVYFIVYCGGHKSPFSNIIPL